VTLASAAVLAIGVAALTLGGYLVLSRQLEAEVSSALTERTQAQLATLDVLGGRVRVHEVANDAVLDRHAWVYARGHAIERPPASAATQRAADALARGSGSAERTVGDRVRLRAEPVYDPSGRRRIGTVVVGLSLTPYEQSERTALLAMLAIALVVLLAGALLARRAVAKALEPVAEMTALAGQWSEHESDLDRRFDRGPARDELTGLAATLDALLARIGASLRHERRFSAEMAHELRTPLAGVRGEAELAMRPGRSPDDVRSGLEQVRAGVDRMESVITTLLAAARNEAGGIPGSCDVRGAVDRAVAAAQATGEGVAIEVRAGPARVVAGAAEEIVLQALQPLLENALRHARSGVVVEVARERTDVVVSVEDDGGGVGDGDPERLFEPGASTTGGAGLGLALARRLARSCGGDVAAGAGPEGARFALRLPAVA
jgi:signal transduction histidine kinase